MGIRYISNGSRRNTLISDQTHWKEENSETKKTPGDWQNSWLIKNVQMFRYVYLILPHLSQLAVTVMQSVPALMNKPSKLV